MGDVAETTVGQSPQKGGRHLFALLRLKPCPGFFCFLLSKL